MVFVDRQSIARRATLIRFEIEQKFVELKNGSPEDPEMLEEQESLAARLP